MKDYFSDWQTRINQALVGCLPAIETVPSRLHEAMHYAVLNGGKRLRPLLVYATGTALGASLEKLDNAACAVELIHAYSLVHDDLPAMDNDDLRRGIPTCHKAFDETTAILVGDALQALAFEVLAQDKQLTDAQRLQMITSLAHASGSLGMVGGQALEFSVSGYDVNILEQIHRLKTGALIQASVRLGAIAAQADQMQLQQFNEFGKCLGLAYQIQDDIDDSESDHTESTYVKCIGLAESKARVHDLNEQALCAIEALGDATPLHDLINTVMR